MEQLSKRKKFCMIDRMQAFTPEEVHRIHDASMEISADAGIAFNSADATALFREHGFKTEDHRVFITENAVRDALETTPYRFTLRARNPEYDVAIGEDDFVFLPTGGAPNVVTRSGVRRPGTLADYHECCRMVQTSDQLDMNGWLMIQPSDLSSPAAHLDMLLATLTLCDKAFVGAAMSRRAAADCLEMAAIAWGGRNICRRKRKPIHTPAESSPRILDTPGPSDQPAHDLPACGRSPRRRGQSPRRGCRHGG